MFSYLCTLINVNPFNWEEICEEKRIKVKKDPVLPYAIFNYSIDADFFDPLVQEARGIIIDYEESEVICWPFKKFGNSHEAYADVINWETARVQEKIDGSIIKYWYDWKLERWNWSTNSCIYASEAKSACGLTFQKLIEMTPEYQLLKDAENLNKGYTYIFELTGPDNQVVIKYSESHLWHIGTRDNLTGEEYNDYIGIQKPKEYQLRNLNDCLNAVKNLNKDDFPDHEGFVVVDGKWNRVKIKSPEYLIWHHAVNNGNLNKENVYELVHSDDFDLWTFKSNVSEYVFKKVEFYIREFLYTEDQILLMIEKARNLQKSGLTRKEIALEIKYSRYSYFGFKALDSELSPKDLIRSLGVMQFLKVVDEYVEG